MANINGLVQISASERCRVWQWGSVASPVSANLDVPQPVLVAGFWDFTVQTQEVGAGTYTVNWQMTLDVNPTAPVGFVNMTDHANVVIAHSANANSLAAQGAYFIQPFVLVTTSGTVVLRLIGYRR